jgi:hypothetical protein
MNIPIDLFPLLTTERYLNAVDTAKNQVREHIKAPTLEQFHTNSGSIYPRWFVWTVASLLGLVMLTSFFISSGKQVAVFGMVFDDLPTISNHLSTSWSNMSTIFMLLMSEGGSVLFLLAAGTIGEESPKVALFNREINIAKQVFYLFAFICAGYALSANVTATVLDPVVKASFAQWLASIGIPLTVLGLGMMLERIAVSSMRAGREQRFEFDRAMITYQRAVADPTGHEYYKRALFDSLYAEIVRTKTTRTKLGVLYEQAETNLEVKKMLVGSEYNAHASMALFDMAVASNPFLSPAPADNLTPSLPNGTD